MKHEALAPADACPTRDQLIALLSDDLPHDMSSLLEAHVESCGRCQAGLLELGGLDLEALHAGLETTQTADATTVDQPRGEFLERLTALAVAESAGPATADLHPEEVTGPNLPGIEFLDELGRGSLGIVYLARQKQINRLVAVKVVPVDRFASDQERERARRGVETVTHLEHANIIQIYHVGRHETWFFGTMEFMEGGSLRDRMTGAPWGSMQAAKLLITLARAAAFIHQKGIVHRDLKPANVLFKADGTPKLADFGLARSFAESSNLTLEGEVLGTPCYMAPEQARGRLDLSSSVDIYALGAILYELLTGKPPFRGANKLDTLYQVVHLPAVPVSRLQPGVPQGLSAICMRCLEKTPELRYPTAEAMVQDLERFVQARSIRPRSFVWLQRARTMLANHPVSTLFALMLLFVALLELMAMVSLWLDTAEVNRRDRAQLYNNQVMQLNNQLMQARNEMATWLPDLAEYEIKAGNKEKARSLLEKVEPNSRDANWQKLMDQSEPPAIKAK